jgi:hypothetical protein
MLCWVVGSLALVVWLAPEVSALELTRDTDPNLPDLLSRMEILQEKQTNFADVRVMRSVDSGECDPGHEWDSCPHGELLLVIAEDAEGPWDAVLWRSPRRIGWDFVKWLDTGKIDPANVRLGEFWLEVRVCEAPLEVENGHVDPRKGGWWAQVTYEIHLGHERTSVKPLAPPHNDHCELY